MNCKAILFDLDGTLIDTSELIFRSFAYALDTVLHTSMPREELLWTFGRPLERIMDTLGGLAFAGEAPNPDYMNEKPKKREEPILNKYMISQIALSGIFTVGLFIAFLLCPAITSNFKTSSDNSTLLSAFFALFIFLG